MMRSLFVLIEAVDSTEHDHLNVPQEQTGEGRKLACVPRDPGLVSRKAAPPENGRALGRELSGFANAVAGFARGVRHWP